MDILWIVLAILLALIVFFTAAWLFCIAPARPRGNFYKLLRFDYAHRGLHEKDLSVPENSLAAFRAAVRAGYGIEWDLQLTRDKKVVVHHDRSLKRVCGADISIGDLSYKQLKEYRLHKTNERIPLFSEALTVVGGKVPLIIELKSYDPVDILCPLVWEILKDYKGEYCIESFDPKIVAWFRTYHPHVLRGQLMAHFTGKEPEFNSGFKAFFARNLWTNVVSRPHFEAYDLHARNNISHRIACGLMKMQEASWTIRTAEEYRLCKSAGALCIFEYIRPEISDGHEH